MNNSGGSSVMAAGLGPAGLGSGGIVAVHQTSLNAVSVVFDVPVQQLDASQAGDALNPNNWSVQVIAPYGAAGRLTQVCFSIDPYTIRIGFDGQLTPAARYGLRGSDVLAGNGAPLLELYAEFIGVSSKPMFTQTQRQATYDLANPQLLQDALVFDPPPLGTYQLTDTGDYANDSQNAALRKRVIRRATTKPSGYFHLPGYGFLENEKINITPTLLRRMQQSAQAQIMREPEVASVAVAARQHASATDVVTLWIKVRTIRGVMPPFSVPVRLG